MKRNTLHGVGKYVTLDTKFHVSTQRKIYNVKYTGKTGVCKNNNIVTKIQCTYTVTLYTVNKNKQNIHIIW